MFLTVCTHFHIQLIEISLLSNNSIKSSDSQGKCARRNVLHLYDPCPLIAIWALKVLQGSVETLFRYGENCFCRILQQTDYLGNCTLNFTKSPEFCRVLQKTFWSLFPRTQCSGSISVKLGTICQRVSGNCGTGFHCQSKLWWCAMI